MFDSVYILFVLCLLVALTEWLVKRTFFRHLGSALLVILLTAIVANIGLIPAGSTPENPVPAYEAVFGYIAPIAIFLLLLPVNLRDILKAGRPLIALFLIGALGTAAGVTIGMWLIDGPARIGEQFLALGSMFTGTYIGGGVNFNALALHYNIVQDGVLYGGAVAVDNIMTALWMMVTLVMPRFMGALWKRRAPASASYAAFDHEIDVAHDVESVSPLDLGTLLALSLGALWVAQLGHEWLSSMGYQAPVIILISVLALAIAQAPAVQRIAGARVLGYFTVILFLAVIGAYCDLAALRSLGGLGLGLFLFVVIIVGVHGLFVFGAAWLFRMDPDLAAIASQANIGGSPSALALARSLDRQDLVLPAVLVGSLGYALGTFIGLGHAEFVLSPLF